MLSVDLSIRTVYVGKFLKNVLPDLKFSVAVALAEFLPYTGAVLGLCANIHFQIEDLLI